MPSFSLVNIYTVFDRVLYVKDYGGKKSICKIPSAENCSVSTVSLSNTANGTCRFSRATETLVPILVPTLYSTSEYL